MELPDVKVYSISSPYYRSLDLTFSAPTELLTLGLYLMIATTAHLYGIKMDSNVDYVIDCNVKNILHLLVNKNILYKDFKNKWAFDVLTLVLDNYGYSFSERLNSKNPFTQHNFYYNKYNYVGKMPETVELLFDGEYNLCDQVLKLGAKSIERLERIFINNGFSKAVQVYKNELIVQMSGI